MPATLADQALARPGHRHAGPRPPLALRRARSGSRPSGPPRSSCSATSPTASTATPTASSSPSSTRRTRSASASAKAPARRSCARSTARAVRPRVRGPDVRHRRGAAQRAAGEPPPPPAPPARPAASRTRSGPRQQLAEAPLATRVAGARRGRVHAARAGRRPRPRRARAARDGLPPRALPRERAVGVRPPPRGARPRAGALASQGIASQHRVRSRLELAPAHRPSTSGAPIVPGTRRSLVRSRRPCSVVADVATASTASLRSLRDARRRSSCSPARASPPSRASPTSAARRASGRRTPRPSARATIQHYVADPEHRRAGVAQPRRQRAVRGRAQRRPPSRSPSSSGVPHCTRSSPRTSTACTRPPASRPRSSSRSTAPCTRRSASSAAGAARWTRRSTACAPARTTRRASSAAGC